MLLLPRKFKETVERIKDKEPELDAIVERDADPDRSDGPKPRSKGLIQTCTLPLTKT